MTRSRMPGSTRTSGSESGMSTATAWPAGPRSSRARATISSSPAGRGNTDSAPACSRLMSSRLSTRWASRSSDSSAVASSSSRSSCVPLHVGRPQAGHRGLGRGQRGAQVVADRREQRGAHPVRLGDGPGRLGLGGQPLLLQRRRRVGGERAQHPAVGRGQRGGRAGPATGSRPPAPPRRRRPAGPPAARRSGPPPATRRSGRGPRCSGWPRTPAGSPTPCRTPPGPGPAPPPAPAAPRSTLPAVVTSSSDSALARAACRVRRAALSTTELTISPTATNTTSARALLASAMVNWCSGGVK